MAAILKEMHYDHVIDYRQKAKYIAKNELNKCLIYEVLKGTFMTSSIWQELSAQNPSLSSGERKIHSRSD